MDTQNCVRCHNKNPVNSTTNRLVTESCGHIKCMDCLLLERLGCIACLEENRRMDSADPLIVNGKEQTLIQCQVVLPDESVIEEHNKDTESISTVVIEKKRPDTSHIRIETDGNRRHYLCTVCKKKFYGYRQVAYHAYCNGQRKPFQCPECSKTFTTHSHYKYHMRVHRDERTYACEVCGESFFQKSKLQRHMLKHTKEKRYSCGYCNKAFNNMSALRKHIMTHTGERPYSCVTCGLRFRDSSNFKKHLAKHEGPKCSCGVCGRCRLQHTARAHQCPCCPKSFHSSKDMRRHSAVHTDSKPFRCKVCNRYFRRKDNLERHIRNTHPDYLPATAVEYNENVIKQISDKVQDKNTDKVYENNEKLKLELLNPLPPLPEEVIQKHMHTEIVSNSKNEEKLVENDLSIKSFILEANIARQSVIFGPIKKNNNEPRKITSPNHEYEYVHKIRKANYMASQKHLSLPPIDEKKIIELEHKTNTNNLDVGAPPKNMELYKKILFEEPDKEAGISCDEDIKTGLTSSSPEMHWRRKLKLNIN